jgi:hypothetical protein
LEDAVLIPAVQALADHWHAIEEARKAAGFQADAPVHAVTVREYAEKFELNEQTARRELTALAKAGRLESGRKLVIGRDGRQMIASCFWPKEETQR